ncbi:MAG: hypothetical protein GX620_10060 [Chloroflexi bacterium]|nr:hypothetical protein [Chloroflexota bacterium]
MQWGKGHIDKVHGLVFITYRTFNTDANVGVDAQGQEVDATRLSYSAEHFDEQFVTSLVASPHQLTWRWFSSTLFMYSSLDRPLNIGTGTPVSAS